MSGIVWEHLKSLETCIQSPTHGTAESNPVTCQARPKPKSESRPNWDIETLKICLRLEGNERTISDGKMVQQRNVLLDLRFKIWIAKRVGGSKSALAQERRRQGAEVRGGSTGWRAQGREEGHVAGKNWAKHARCPGGR